MSRDALVVGISHYQYAQDIAAAARDAEAIAQILDKFGGFNVTLFPEAIEATTKRRTIARTPEVVQREATQTKLEAAIAQLFLPESPQAPDTALLFFSGHGWQEKDGLREGFLASSDTHPGQGIKGIRLKWLREVLEASPVKQQVIWLDCCYAGGLLNLGAANPGDGGAGRDRSFIAAARSFEAAQQDLTYPYSALTRALLEALDPRNGGADNLQLADRLNRNDAFRQSTPQRPIHLNFGEAIALTYGDEEPSRDDTPTEGEMSCPYKGLAYFTEGDRANFYGRGDLTAQLLDRVERGNFLAVLGASGSGKSSVLRAGLLYELRRGRRIVGSDEWKIEVFQPGRKPLAALAQVWLDRGSASELQEAETQIAQGSEGLRRLVQVREEPVVLLVCDQFEEVFSPEVTEEERSHFLKTLLGALENTEKLKLLLSMRADFFGKCVDYRQLATRVEQNLLTVKPMTREQLQAAIVKPAHSVPVEPELVRQMLDDLGDAPGSLPLMQFALQQLWQRRNGEGLTLKTYAQVGGVTGALEERADALLAELSPQERETAKHIFLSLVTLGEGTEDTRRRVRQQDSVTAKHPAAMVAGVVRRLADEKLVVTGFVGEATAETDTVEVAHEALIRYWGTLRGWLNEGREALRQKRRIEAAAQDWRQNGQVKGYLLSGERLREARKFLQNFGEAYPLATRDVAFVERSVQQRRWNFGKAVAGLLVIPLLGTAVLVNELRLEGYRRTLVRCEQYGGENCEGVRNALQALHNWKKPIWQFNLSGLTLTKIQIRRANLERANLGGANLERADLEGADLEGANLERADLEGANLGGANLGGANLERADLGGANLWRANLWGADFEGADLGGALVGQALLLEADLLEADLRGADLRGADLRGAKLGGAKLGGAKLGGANLGGADFATDEERGAVKNLAPEQIRQACYWQEAKFEPEFRAQIESASEPDPPINCRYWELD